MVWREFFTGCAPSAVTRGLIPGQIQGYFREQAQPLLCLLYANVVSTGNEAIVEPERKWYSRKHISHHKHEPVTHSNPVESQLHGEQSLSKEGAAVQVE